MMSDDVQLNVSCAQPYCTAEQSTADLCPRTAKCKEPRNACCCKWLHTRKLMSPQNAHCVKGHTATSKTFNGKIKMGI